MNVLHKVAFESLKKSRTRTIVTIIGIMLSTALIFAVTSSASSFVSFFRRYTAYTYGEWHGLEKCTSFEDYESISSSDEVETAVYDKYEGYADVSSELEDISDLYLNVFGINEDFQKLIPVHITSGCFPKNENEILIPEFFSVLTDSKYEVGDKITLKIGDVVSNGEYILPTADKSNFYYWENDNSNKEFIEREEKTYTICGIFEMPAFSNIYSYGITAFTFPTETEYLTNSYDYFYSLKNPSDISSFMKENSLDGETNNEYLLSLGFSRYNSVTKSLFGVVAIVIVIVMLGSVVLIYNAFSISISERTKQFGILSSVGATKSQLRKMITFESFILSVIGIPLGLLLGLIGITVTFSLLEGSFSLLSFGVYDNITIELDISWISVIAAVIIAVVTIRISAWLPSYRASKVSAVDAIRQTTDVKMPKKDIRTPRIIYKLFGISGVLGHKYYKRSRKKYRSTIISLFMSIVLFISASAFTNYIVDSSMIFEGVESTETVYNYDISVEYFLNAENDMITPESLTNKMSVNSEINDYSYFCNFGTYFRIPYNNISDKIKNYVDSVGFFSNMGDMEVFSFIYFIKDDTFKEILKKNNLSESKFMNPDEPLGVTFDTTSVFDEEAEKFINIDVFSVDEITFKTYCYKDIDGYNFSGADDKTAEYIKVKSEAVTDTIKLPIEECRTDLTLKSGATIHKPISNMNHSSAFYLFFPYSAAEKIIPNNNFDELSFLIKTDNHLECCRQLTEMHQNEKMNYGIIYDKTAEIEQEENIVLIIKVFAYGFIILISLIAAANVFNTITTNIGLRRRDFSMLQSIGMNLKEMRKMLYYECILYGTKALLFGLPVSFLITFLIYHAVNLSVELSFFIPWKAVIIAGISVFFVVFATMLYASRKLKTSSTVDNLKNENL